MSPCAPQLARRGSKRRAPFLRTASLRLARWAPARRRFCCVCAGRPARKSSGSRSAISPATSSCFLAGCLGAKSRWLENVPANQLMTWPRVSLIAALAFPLALIAAHPSAGAQNTPNGGFSIVAALYAVWEPLFAWGVILTLLVVYQRRFVALSLLWRA